MKSQYYQILQEEKETLKKLGYILFKRNKETYLYHIKTGTLKRVNNEYFCQVRDFALFYSEENKKFVKSFSIENSNVDLLYRKEDEISNLEVTIHLGLYTTMELSLSENRVSLDFYNGNAFQFMDLKINPINKEYDFYFEDNMKQAVIFYGRSDVYYSSSWNYLDSVSNFFEDETSFLKALLSVLTSPTLNDYYQMCFEIIERYIPGILSILEEYPILNSQKELIENNKTILKKKVYKRIQEKEKI